MNITIYINETRVRVYFYRRFTTSISFVRSMQNYYDIQQISQQGEIHQIILWALETISSMSSFTQDKYEYPGLKHEQINRATKCIDEASKQPGYIPALLDIINSKDISVQITQSALIQLKVFLRNRWMFNLRMQDQIPDDDKKMLLRLIIDMVKNFCANFRYANLLLDSLKIIGTNLCSEETSLFKIIKLIDEGQVKAALLCILGIAQAYRFIPDVKPLIWLLKETLSSVYEKLFIKIKSLDQQKNNWQIYYYGFKLATKLFYFRQIQIFKHESFKWVELAIDILGQYLLSLTQQSKFEWQDLKKQHITFYFYHTIKWVIKLLQKYILSQADLWDQHDKHRYNLSENEQKFLRQHFFTINELAIMCMAQPLPEKIKFTLLKLIHIMVKHRKKQYIQYEGLATKMMNATLAVIKLGLSEKQILAYEQNPTSFVEMEQQKWIWEDFCSCRMEALQIWRRIVSINNQQKGYSPIVVQTVNTIKGLCESTDTSSMGLFLFCSIKPVFDASFEVQKQLRPIIDNIEVYLLINNEEIKFRALQTVATYYYSFTEQKRDWLRTILIEWVLVYPDIKDQSQSQCVLIIINSCIALQYIMTFDIYYQRNNVPTEKLKELLNVLLEITNQLEFEKAMGCFNAFIKIFQEETKDYTSELIQAMKTNIVEHTMLNQEDTSQMPALKLRSKHQELAQQCANTLCFLAQSIALNPSFSQFRKQFEESIFFLVYNMLDIQNSNSEMYYSIITPIISTYLEYVKELSPAMLFLYQFFVYRVIRLPREQLLLISAAYQGTQRQMLQVCRPCEEYNLQSYFIILRCYIRLIPMTKDTHIRLKNEIQNDCLHASPIELYYLAICMAIQRKESMNRKELSMLLLLYLNEIRTTQVPSRLLTYSASLSFQIIIKIESTYPILFSYAVQIFCLWLVNANPEQVVIKLTKLFASKGKNRNLQFQRVLFENQFSFIFIRQNYYSRSRVILGLSRLLKLSQYFPDLNIQNCQGPILRWLIELCYAHVSQIQEQYINQYGEQWYTERQKLEGIMGQENKENNEQQSGMNSSIRKLVDRLNEDYLYEQLQKYEHIQQQITQHYHYHISLNKIAQYGLVGMLQFRFKNRQKYFYFTKDYSHKITKILDKLELMNQQIGSNNQQQTDNVFLFIQQKQKYKYSDLIEQTELVQWNQLNQAEMYAFY